jgi:hypothetical protein
MATKHKTISRGHSSLPTHGLGLNFRGLVFQGDNSIGDSDVSLAPRLNLGGGVWSVSQPYYPPYKEVKLQNNNVFRLICVRLRT